MRFVVLFIFIAYSVTARAQSSGHIEFSISDTVKISPDKIIYTVIIQSAPDYETDIDNPVNEFKLKETDQRFIKICSKLNLHPALQENGTKYRLIPLSPYQGKSIQYNLEFKSEAQLEKLHQELKLFDNISAGITESKVTPEREAAARQKLLAKLKLKANTEAQLLAKAFDKTAGAIISMNFYEGHSSGYSVYPGARAHDVYYEGFMEESLFFVLGQSVSFKVELK